MSNLSDLIANHARIVARYGRDIDRRHLPPECAVTVPVERWPAIPDPRLRLGVTCGKCGADDWRQARNRSGVPTWRVCRPCENRKAVRNQKRARAALAERSEG